MATVYGSRVGKVWRAYMTYVVTTTPTQVKVSITSGLNIPSDTANSSQSYTCTISGTEQAVVSGSIPSARRTGVLTKAIKSATYTWNRASTAQTKTIKTVLRGSGQSTTSSCSASISVPALAPVTITFDANNGSGTVPTAISTYVGVANTIPSNTLTRTGYTFNGWNTASDGSGTSYATGSSITPSSDVTLYAQWQTTYVKPEIQSLLAFRVENASGGATPSVASTGTTGFCRFELVGGANYTFTSATVQFDMATANPMTKSGNTVYGYSSVGSIAETSPYTVKVTIVVTEADGISRTYTDSTYISMAFPVFDVSSDGNCFAFFGSAIDGKLSPVLLVNGEMILDTALSISNGGTGAATAAEAMTNLGVVDYVVEQGESGNWTYKKWNSGEVECWYHANYGTITLSTALGTDIVSNGFRFTFPFEFSEVPTCIVCYEGNSTGYAEMQAVGAGGGATTTQSAMYRLVRIGSATISLTNNMFSIYVKGKVS